ncbi:MAG: ABC transporter transmembrane domain-containing protein [Elusimicrobia bacterium]|nr:ABC transporter transmembrane domain-containing protein [Elusimicrobiota bacterium]
MNVPARFGPYLRPHRRRFAWAVAAMCAVAAFNGGAVLLLKPIVDRIFIARDLRMLWLAVLAVPLLMAGKTAVSYVQNYLMSWIGQSVTQSIREDLFRNLLLSPPRLAGSRKGAEVLSRVTNDLAIMQTELVSVPLYLIRDSMTLVFLSISLLYLDWRLALLALAGTPATVVAFVILSRKMRRYSLQSQAVMERLTDRFEASLSGASTLDEFQKENAVFFSLMMRYLRATALAAPLMELCGSLAVAALLYFGGREVINGQMTPGAFFAFLGAFLSAYAPIKNLARTNSDLQRALASGERIFELLDRAPAAAVEAR